MQTKTRLVLGCGPWAVIFRQDSGRTGRNALTASPPERLPFLPALLPALVAEERATLASALAPDVDVQVLVILYSALAAGAPFVQKVLDQTKPYPHPLPS